METVSFYVVLLARASKKYFSSFARFVVVVKKIKLLKNLAYAALHMQA